jgi:mannose-6-phosphate isomerase-like protein (cupin superfamily)
MGGVVSLAEKFALFDEAWSPKVVGEVNDCQVKLVKLRGEFVWHAHAEEDEMFFVVSGVLRMELRDRIERIGEGEFIVVPKGVEHRPVAETDEVEVMLFERATTLNTGDAPKSERTVERLDRI